jgi:hypothetical protein
MLYFAHQKDIQFEKIKAQLSEKKITTWYYFGEDTNWRIQVELVIPEDIKHISIAQLLEKTTQKLRKPYIDWIGKVSEQNHSLLWWSSELAAKNPYYMLFTRICHLNVAYHMIHECIDQSTLMIFGTPALYLEITSFCNRNGIHWEGFMEKPVINVVINRLHKKGYSIARDAAEFFPPIFFLGRLSSTYKKFLEKHIVYRQKILKKHGIKYSETMQTNDSVLFFSWIDRRNFTPDGSYIDPNFGPLPEIYKNKGFRIGFVPRVLHTISFEEAVIRLKKTNESLFYPEQFIQYSDLKKFTHECKDFSPVLSSDACISGIPVYSLAVEHFEQTRSLMPENLLYDTLIRRMHEAGINPSIIIHTCEGHSWENTLSWAVHHHMQQTKVLGYDNVTFSRFVLSMYPSQKEFSFKPLPDYLVTNGPLFRETLKKEGYDNSRIRCGCALRHTYLWKQSVCDLNTPPKTATYPVRILIATAVGLGDSVELIAKAAQAFGGIDKYEILIKCHPLVNISEVKRHLAHLLNHKNINFSTSTVGELLPLSDILLYTYTSVCYEALMHGVYPICVIPENFINLDKLDATPEIRMLVTTAEELYEAAEKIVSMSPEERIRWQSNARTIVRRALAPVDDRCINAFLL